MIITGKVVKGDGRGRGLGWPTANMSVPPGFAAADGVYAAWVEVDGVRRGAMANLGVKPTFGGGDGARLLELHIFDYEGDLYGREIRAELVERIRSEQKFKNPSALRTQIAKDEKIAKNILKCI